MKKRKGFTLIELLMTIAVMAIVMGLVVNLLRVPTKANQMSTKEFQVQSSLRTASQSVNNSVRDASAVCLLTKETPVNIKDDLSEKWDYLVCEEKGGVSEVVHYRWMKTGTGWQHVRKVIAEAKSEKVHFFIDFETSDNGKLLHYKIMTQDIETGQKQEVSSEIKPLNSFNIVDNAKRDPFTGKKSANALAFRTDVPDPSMGGQQGYEKITVSLVLDTSGSMNSNIGGSSTPHAHARRINILKKKANDLVDKLASSPNKERIEVVIYPFANEVKGTHFTFTPLQKDGVMQDHMVKSKINALGASGATNVGDGIRWAYHGMLDVERANQTKSMKHFILVLTDGEPNYYSHVNNNPFYGAGKPSKMRVKYDFDKSVEYMTTMANYVKRFPKHISGENKLPNISANAESVDATVIGFSSRAQDNKRCTDLGKSIGAEPGPQGKYFITADSEAALDAAFSQFTTKVLDKASLWYVVSPK